MNEEISTYYISQFSNTFYINKETREYEHNTEYRSFPDIKTLCNVELHKKQQMMVISTQGNTEVCVKLSFI